MAFQGNQGLITNPDSNYFSFQARKYNEGKVPLPSEIISGSTHICVVDSRERNLTLFPNPATYSIAFPDAFKNVTSIELKGSIMPKTETNVNTENNKISYNVEDFVTEVKVLNRGQGYVDGVYTTGVFDVTGPGIVGGTTAIVTVTVLNGQIVPPVIINNPGSGYLRGSYGSSIQYPAEGFYRNSGASIVNRIPTVAGATVVYAEFQVEVGHEIVAKLIPGQYDFAHPNDSQNGLCREVTRALQESMQEAIDDGIVVPIVGGPQTGAEYFPYSVADTDDGSCFLYTPNPNSSENSNVSIQRGSDDGTYTQYPFLELLFASGTTESSSYSVLGYGSEYIETLGNVPLDQTNGVISFVGGIWSSIPVSGRHPYNLSCFPKYCIVSFGTSQTGSTDRIESTNETLDKAFATLIFDGNPQDIIWRAPSDNPVAGEGNSSFSTLLNKPGTLKGIKGHDFDNKVLRFGPAPLSELRYMTIRLQKFNGELYDFKGQEHLLIFEIGANDINSGNRW